ncbi:unnamed protein product [Sphacelaria rigidula]
MRFDISRINPMIAAKIATPYAEALLQIIASLEKATSRQKQNMSFTLTLEVVALEQALTFTPKFEEYISDPLVPKNSKECILMNHKKNSVVSSMFYKFLQVLMKKKRINFLRKILQIVLKKEPSIRKFFKYKIIEVVSVCEFTAAQKKKLKNTMINLIGPSIITHIRYSQDKEILGGFIIKYDSTIIDLSLRGKLQSLTKQIKTNILNY